AQHDQHQGGLQRKQCCQMLTSAQYHVGQSDLVRAAQRLTQQGIDLFTPVVRGQVVRGVDVLQRYLLTVDKRKNVDRLGRLGVSGTDFLLTQHHVAPLLVS